MRHRHHGKKLNRSGSHRKALRMNLATQLLTHGRIRTTFHKAKFVQGHAERLITLAKRGLAKADERAEVAPVNITPTGSAIEPSAARGPAISPPSR